MNFPHMKDNDFPYVNNVDVFKFQNDFNYARWNGVIKFKMLNVLWNSTYNDVPWFTTDKERDAWFDAKKGISDSFESAMQITPETTLKVPVPYNDAFEYNYLMVEMPMQTSVSQPIDYTSNKRIARWYFFIESATQFSPSTTELTLSLDYWTTFINKVEIPYLMLNRGHAPMTMTTVEQYLANPIENNEYLLADDFNYGTTTLNIVSSTFQPVGNGRKYVLFAAPYNQDDFDLFGGVVYSGQSTPPTFSSTEERYGWMLQVNDYEWKYGKADYSNASLPIEAFESESSKVFNGCNCFAVRSESATAFFKNMATYHVNFIHGIQACFILDESMFARSSSFNFHGYEIFNVEQLHMVQDFKFNKNAFEYDEKYANIAKLYTSPYAYMEITDDDGTYFTVNIENCGNLQMHREVSLAFPFIRYNIFYTGIDGNGQFNYTWRNINNQNVNKTMWESDFARYMFNWDIPTYGIYVSNESEYAANNAAGMAAKRQRAITDYENATRFANTAWANTRDSMATNTANVAASGATDVSNVAASGETNTTNVNASTTTMLGNTQAIQFGLVENMKKQNATNELVTNDYTNGGSFFAAGTDGHGFTQQTAWANYEKISDDGDTDWLIIEKSTGIENDYISSSATVNTGASVGGSIIGAVGTLGASVVAGAAVGGPAGAGAAGAVTIGAAAVGGAVTAISAAASNSLTVSNNESIKNIQQQAITEKNVHARTLSTKLCDIKTNYDALVVAAQNDMNITCVNRFSDQETGINILNAKSTKNTDDANASRTQETNNANANRTASTNNANAARTQNTETNNASETDTVSVIAYQNDLKVKQLEAEAQYKNARLQKPTIQGVTQGNAYPDIWERRGIRMNIRTQTKSAIAQAGDAMLRFGYALHRVWDMSKGFHYGKHFTYWKADDVWINDGAGVANVATRAIGRILTDGVTIWRNPDEIGTIGIYNNI